MIPLCALFPLWVCPPQVLSFTLKDVKLSLEPGFTSSCVYFIIVNQWIYSEEFLLLDPAALGEKKEYNCYDFKLIVVSFLTSF